MSAPEKIGLVFSATGSLILPTENAKPNKTPYIRADVHEAEISALKAEVERLRERLTEEIPVSRNDLAARLERIEKAFEPIAEHLKNPERAVQYNFSTRSINEILSKDVVRNLAAAIGGE